MGRLVKKLDSCKAVSRALQVWLDKWWLHSPDTRARRSLVNELQKIIDGRSGHVQEAVMNVIVGIHDKLDESNHKRGRSNFNSILSSSVCSWNDYVMIEGLDCPTVHIPIHDEDIADMTDNEKERIISQEPIIDKSILDKISEAQFKDIVEQTGKPIDDSTVYPIGEQPVQMEPNHTDEVKVQNQNAVIDIWIPSGGEMIHITIDTNPKR